MASTPRAPRLWCLTKIETVNTFENWPQNVVYTLSLDKTLPLFWYQEHSGRRKRKPHYSEALQTMTRIYQKPVVSLATKSEHTRTHVGTDCQLLPNYIKKHNCEKFYFDWPGMADNTTSLCFPDDKSPLYWFWLYSFWSKWAARRSFSAINCVCWGQCPSQRYSHKSSRTGTERGRRTMSLAWELYCLHVASSPSPRTSSARQTEIWNRPTCKDVGLDQTWNLASTRISSGKAQNSWRRQGYENVCQ